MLVKVGGKCKERRKIFKIGRITGVKGSGSTGPCMEDEGESV